jgi:hypothetical protein
MKKPKIKSVVIRGDKLPAKHFGSWANGKHVISPDSLIYMLPYALELCGDPPYDLTIEVR